MKKRSKKKHISTTVETVRKETDRCGNTSYYDENNELHRDNDLPAIECANGDKWWYQHGERHRDNDLPAIEYANGDKSWYQHGKFHRDNDLPAIEHANGDKCWYQHDKFHRDNDLPAIECANGDKHWYQHGKCHRDNDLPAIEYADGNKYWYQHHKFIRQEYKANEKSISKAYVQKLDKPVKKPYTVVIYVPDYKHFGTMRTVKIVAQRAGMHVVKMVDDKNPCIYVRVWDFNYESAKCRVNEAISYPNKWFEK